MKGLTNESCARLVVRRWTAAFHTFAQVEEEETKPRSGSVGNKLTKNQDRLVSDKSASELVRLITQMTPVRHVCLFGDACSVLTVYILCYIVPLPTSAVNPLVNKQYRTSTTWPG